MADFIIRVKSSQVTSYLSKLPQSLKQKGLRSGLHAVAVELQGRIRTEMSGATLHRRSGRLQQSVKKSAVSFDDTGARVSVFSDSRYAQTHEQGLTIHPHKRQFLAIPFTGTPKGLTVRQALKQGAFISDGFVIGKSSLLQRTWNPLLFSLKRSVTIPRRPIWGPVASKSQAYITSLLSNALERVLRAEDRK